MRRRIIIGLLLSLTVLALLWIRIGGDRVYQTGPPSTRCEEDMSCWNCSTMGNKVCGN